MISLWIITKDIRLEDNYTLAEASKNSSLVYPVFVFDEEQFRNGNSSSVHFLIESLYELNEKLKSMNSCIHIVQKNNFDAFVKGIKCNKAYILKGFTDFEKQRGVNYSSILSLTEIDDALGADRKKFLKADKTPYRVFSKMEQSVNQNGGLAFYTMNATYPNLSKLQNFDTFDFNSLKFYTGPRLPEATWKGGSNEGLLIASNKFNKVPNQDISPHVKFGTISPRLVYQCSSECQRGILWRGLYYNLMDQNMIYLKQRNIVWNNDPVKFQHWCNGTTGFDLVDAGINQLIRSGIMDNKIRMLVANFLVFVLNIDWRYGEEFFRKNLVDYDWPLNVGNWAWCAQVGIDHPRPNSLYSGKQVRIFNPDTYLNDKPERKAFRNLYISKWLPRPQNTTTKIADFNLNVAITVQYY
uniref:Photolyase/cryptochrome alpha/beta domain-containing protein n=1 Tax=viral metagenome TaxID=1070528 RepID=A0A6C0BEU7_9ZZZZ